MGSIRQSKIERAIQESIAELFQREAKELCLGAMVTPTVVRITPDLSLARIYVSIFAPKKEDEVFKEIQVNKSKIRGGLGVKLKNMRHIPDLQFFIDDSLDYAEKIDELLKK